MALKAILTAEEHGKLGDGLKTEYKEENGKFILDVTPTDGFSLEDVSGLKTSLGTERASRTAAEKKIEKFKDLDPNIDWKALQQENEELKAIDPKKEADKLANTKFESAKAQLTAAHAKELKARDDRSVLLTRTIEELLVDSVAKSEIAEAKGSIELLLPHIRSQTRVTEADGKFSVEVIGKDGNVRIGGNKGEPMDIKGLIAEMKASDTFGRAFEGEGTSGSGKRPGGGGGGMPNSGLKRSQMTAEQKRDYQQKHGQEAFLKLPLK